MKLLLTAFEPFGGETLYAAWEAVMALDAPEGLQLCRLQVPTVFGLAGDTVWEAIERERPDAVLCVGQAAGRAALTPERAALNLRDASIPDNAGNQPQDEPVVPGGPAAYFTTLSARKMAEAIQRTGVPASISNSAGTFVCNDLLYSLLHRIARESLPLRCGFVHVPCLPEQAANRGEGMPSLPLEETVRGLEAALAVLTKE